MRAIDHIVHAVDDLDEVARAYESAGFVVTPRADHPFGTSNRLVVARNMYIEIVAVTAPDRLPSSGFAADVATHLAVRGEGIAFLVLTSDDPRADAASLGPLVDGEVFSFSRPAPLVDGSSTEASFSCVFTAGTPDLGVFLCHHHTPDAVWNPPAMAHPNGGSSIVGVDLDASPDSARLVGNLAGASVTDGALQLGRFQVRFGRPAAISWDAAVDVTVSGVSVTGERPA